MQHICFLPNIYAVILSHGSLEISSFTKENGVSIDKISKVSLLGSNDKISISEKEKGIKITMPASQPCEHAYCLKFELK
jgi:alpha-L-fucosidase